MRRVNYRHAFHAGNFGDCMKHALLVWLLRALQRKPAPLFVLDTHAGAGRYDLDSGPADAHRRMAERHRAAARRSAGGAGRLRRPGAVGWASIPARRRSRARCCAPMTGWPAASCTPTIRRRLRRHFAARPAGRGASSRCVGGAWRAAAAAQRRGLVLIDPPYEDAARVRRPWRTGLPPAGQRVPHRRVRRLVSDQASRPGARNSSPPCSRAASATSSPPNFACASRSIRRG